MNLVKHPILFLFTLCSLFSINTNAQLVINEFSGANYQNLSDNFGNNNVDWIEIYNMGNIPLDLSGYHMSDNDNNLDKFVFPAGITIGANSYRIIYATGNDSYDGTNIHADFKLRQTDNEWIILSDPNLNILDSYQINIPNQKNHSWARSPDGTGDFAIATNPTPNGSNGATFASYVPKPMIAPTSGFYTGSVTVELSNDNPGATLYYTTDGSSPTNTSTQYTGPFTLNATAVIRVIAYDSDPTILQSHENYHTYFIDENHTLPVVSISGDELTNLLNGTQNTPEGTFEMFDETGDRVADCTGEFNKHGNDSWAYSQRGIDYVTRDQFGDDYAIKYQLFDSNISDRTSFQRIILKAAANDNYPFEDGGAHIRDSYVHTLSQHAGLEMDERTHRSCVMYVNGEYWGVYDIREKVDDHDFTEHYYNQGRDDIDYIKTWGGTWAEYGSANDWDALVDYILANDMTDPVHYNYVDGELNMLSLIDYMILHAHIVSSDWLNWNTSWWRGRDPNGGALKWQYSLWDEDATFGHYINYTDIPDQSPLADPCNPEILGNPGGQGHVPILNALLENEDFFGLYINRYADLNNLYFNCDYMLPLLDEMTGLIAPEMTRQVNRWGGSVAEWESNVLELRDFIEERCAIIDTAIVNCYEDEGLSGPWEMVIEVDPPGGGFVQANTTIGINYPWVTTYFGGIGVNMTAIPEEDWLFVSWEVANNPYTPGPLSPEIGFTLDTLETIIAHFEPGPCLGVWVDPGLPDQMYRCAGSTLTLQAATGPGYTYEWSTGETTSSIVVDDNSDYSVTVYNSTGCDGYVEIDVDEVDFLAPNIEGSTVFCTGFSTNLDAGTYVEYLWSTGETTQSIDVNTPGTYTVMVTDNSGCTGESEVIIEETDGLETEITGNLSICEGTFGTLLASGNYSTYEWSNGEQTAAIEVSNAGVYTVTVSDGTGCTGTDEVSVSSGTVSMTSETVQLCYGGEFMGSQYFQTAIVENTYDGYNGCDSIHTATVNVYAEVAITLGTSDDCVSGGATIVAAPIGGSGTYTYLWSTGETTQSISQNPQGTYSVTVTDDFGCTNENSVFVDPAPGINLDYEVDAVSCYGDTNGQIDLSIITAAEPYTTTWSNGETTEDLYDLAPGNYTLLVSDANGCNFGITITVGEPDLLQANMTSTPVFNEDDGTASAQPSGGVSPYTYQWLTGHQTATVTDLELGIYLVTITDANGCTTEAEVEVTIPVSVNDIEELISFDIRPNPSSGLFNVLMEFDEVMKPEVNVFNLLGQNIASYSPDRNQRIDLPVDIRGVADGTYILIVEIGEKRLARKVVITQ